MGNALIFSPDFNVLGNASLGISEGKIISIELLEGDAENTNKKTIQYVNICKNKANHIDGIKIKHVDRLGQKIRCLVKFNNSGIYKFKIKLNPDKNNIIYSNTEKANNNNFKYSDGEIEFITEPNGEKIIDTEKLFLTAAGEDSYRLSAVDLSGNKVISHAIIRTKRLLYLIEIKMKGLTSITPKLSIFINEYAKHGIIFKEEPSWEIPHQPNIKNNKETQMLNVEIFKSYSKSNCQQISPYCVGIVYVDQLAIKKAGLSIKYNSIKGGSKKYITIPIIDNTTALPCFLWNNVDPAESWYVECYFIKNGGKYTDKINIPETCCKIEQSPGAPNGYYDKVKIDISKLPKETGYIELKVDCVERMRGGVALSGPFPVAVVCTRAWWAKIPDSKQNNIAIHEIGHKLGMVSDGKSGLPDKPKYYYQGLGHIGNHCHNGIAPGLNSYRTQGINSICVMFGEVTQHSSFCKDCAEVLKKIDLSTGIK